MKKTFLIIFLIVTLCSFLLAGGEGANTYQAIDAHADNVPASALKSIKSLTNYLIKPDGNDREKARAIYRWIAMNISYDTKKYFSGRKKRRYADPAKNTFKTRKSVCEGYARLFKRMCDIAEIKAEVISGYSKGFSYTPGKRFSGDSDHAWNAVQVDGKWYLLDSTWGAGSVDDKTHKFARNFDKFWFLTPPEYFIYSHFPEDKKWQLLSSKISLAEFQESPDFNNYFFKLGFDPNDNKHARLKAAESMILTFKLPKDTVIMSSLSYWKSPNLKKSYTLVRRKEDAVDIIVSFPSKGTYELKLYAKNKYKKGSYNFIVSYRINVPRGNKYKTLAKTYELYNSAPVLLDEESPIYQSLKSGHKYFFKLTVPGADGVAVINKFDNSWQHLDKNGDTFEGWANIKRGAVNVSAKFPDNGETYNTLLKYRGN